MKRMTTSECKEVKGGCCICKPVVCPPPPPCKPCCSGGTAPTTPTTPTPPGGGQ